MQADWLWYLQKSMFNKIMVTEVKCDYRVASHHCKNLGRVWCGLAHHVCITHALRASFLVLTVLKCK